MRDQNAANFQRPKNPTDFEAIRIKRLPHRDQNRTVRQVVLQLQAAKIGFIQFEIIWLASQVNH